MFSEWSHHNFVHVNSRVTIVKAVTYSFLLRTPHFSSASCTVTFPLRHLYLSHCLHSKGFLQLLRRDGERMSKQAQTDLGQRAQTLAPAVESRRENAE